MSKPLFNNSIIRNRHNPNLIYRNLICPVKRKDGIVLWHLSPSGYLDVGNLIPGEHWQIATWREWYSIAFKYFINHCKWYIQYQRNRLFNKQQRQVNFYHDYWFLLRHFLYMFGIALQFFEDKKNY